MHEHYDSHLEDFSDRLRRYQRIAGMRGRIEETIAEVTKREGRKYYLKGLSPTLAAAELQGLVTRIIESQRGRVISSQVLPLSEESKTHGLHKVTINVQMAASIVPLQSLLYVIETTEPYLFVEKLFVSSNYSRGYKPVPGIQPEFQVQLTISGYSQVEGNPP